MLGYKTLVSSTIVVATRLGTRTLDLLILLVFARELTPHIFGVVALAMSLVAIAEAVFELPVGLVIIRSLELDDAHLDTAFTLSILRGVGVFLILCGISVPFSAYYGNQKLESLIFILALAPVMRGLVSPRLAVHMKEMNFWRSGAAEAIGKIIAAGFAIPLAMITHNYWSIVSYTVFAPAGLSIASFFMAPYWPRLRLTHWRSFFHFMSWTSAAQVLSAVNWQFERLLLGKLYAPSQLGLFSTANDLANIPLQSIMSPILAPLLSAFCSVAHDREKLSNIYKMSNTALITIGLPLLVGEGFIAGSIIPVILGHKWVGAETMLKLLCVSLIPALMCSSFSPLVMSLGKTKIFFKKNMFELVIKIPLVVVGALWFGFYGVIVGRIISETMAGIFCMIMTRGLIGVGIVEQLMAGWPAGLSALIMAGTIYLTNTLVFDSVSNGVIKLLALVSVGVISYILCLLFISKLNHKNFEILWVVRQNVRQVRGLKKLSLVRHD